MLGGARLCSLAVYALRGLVNRHAEPRDPLAAYPADDGGEVIVEVGG